MSQQPTQAPHLVMRPIEQRFFPLHDTLGWAIQIGQDHMCRPDGTGRITNWLHAEGVSPEVVRREIDVLKALVKRTFKPWERRGVFGDPHGRSRQIAIEALCEAADDIFHAGENEIANWIGRDH